MRAKLHNGGDTELGTEECIGVLQAGGEPKATQGKVSIHKCSETEVCTMFMNS